jgi:hypothetical protein
MQTTALAIGTRSNQWQALDAGLSDRDPSGRCWDRDADMRVEKYDMRVEE